MLTLFFAPSRLCVRPTFKAAAVFRLIASDTVGSGPGPHGLLWDGGPSLCLVVQNLLNRGGCLT